MIEYIDELNMLLNIAKIIKMRFPNLSTEDTNDLAKTIIICIRKPK